MFVIFVWTLPAHFTFSHWILHGEGKSQQSVNKSCLKGEIADLSNFLEQKYHISDQSSSECLSALSKIELIFELDVSSKPLIYDKNGGFSKKVFKWFNGDTKVIAQFKNQKVITIYNKWTRSTTAYNSIKSKKPKKTQNQETKLVSLIHYSEIVEVILK